MSEQQSPASLEPDAQQLLDNFAKINTYGKRVLLALAVNMAKLEVEKPQQSKIEI